MVSPQRRWEKLQRMESKIMAYDVLKRTGLVPMTNEVLKFNQSRWGQKVMEIETIRAGQAQFDLKTDIEKNLEAMELDWKDYIKHLREQDFLDLIAVLDSIKDPKAPAPKPKKEAKK